MNNLNLEELQRLQQQMNAIYDYNGSPPDISNMNLKQHTNNNSMPTITEIQANCSNNKNSFRSGLPVGVFQQEGFLQQQMQHMVPNEMMSPYQSAFSPMLSATSNSNGPTRTMPLPPSKLDALQLKVGGIEPFPEKLHRLLLEVEASGRDTVISFVGNDAFTIHQPVSC
jgi:hypothetical protein